MRSPLPRTCFCLVFFLLLPIFSAQAQVVIEERVEIAPTDSTRDGYLKATIEALSFDLRWTSLLSLPRRVRTPEVPLLLRPKLKGEESTVAEAPRYLLRQQAEEAPSSQAIVSGGGAPEDGRMQVAQVDYSGDPIFGTVSLLRNGSVVGQAPINTDGAFTVVYDDLIKRGDEMVLRFDWSLDGSTSHTDFVPLEKTYIGRYGGF